MSDISSYKRKRRCSPDGGSLQSAGRWEREDSLPPAKRSHSALRIVTDPASLQPGMACPESNSADSDVYVDSLFGEAPSTSRSCSSPSIAFETGLHAEHVSGDAAVVTAQRTAPFIPGLHFFPACRLPDELADEIMWTCIRAFFQDSAANQVMLFERAPPTSTAAGGLPPLLTGLLSTLSALLQPLLPETTHALLFPPPDASAPPLARQAILNLYWPGEGITPHVDLLDRFADGIIGVSFGSGCVMRFDRVQGINSPSGAICAQERNRWDVFLPSGSVLVMSGEARYAWTHGIEKRMEDLVEDPADEDAGQSCRWLSREVRLSITFRWLLPGADIVGGPVYDQPAETRI